MKNFNQCLFLGTVASDVGVKQIDYGYRYSFILGVRYFSTKNEEGGTDFLPISFIRSKETSRFNGIKKNDVLMLQGRLISRTFKKEEKKVWIVEVKGYDFYKFEPTSQQIMKEIALIKKDLEKDILLINEFQKRAYLDDDESKAVWI